MFVGGEFYEDERWVTDTPALSTEGLYFFNGGRACLTLIADYLCANSIDKILLPSYLCPSILDVMDFSGMCFSFYKINEDFSIDLDDLNDKSSGCRAVYFINYFGFQPSHDALAVLHSLRQKNILVIEDNAQAGFPLGRIGDFVFNSMRKFCACDGGYMATRINIDPFIKRSNMLPNRRLPIIREYRSQLPAYLFTGRGKRSELEHLFYQAEAYYETDHVIFGDDLEKEKIELLDWQTIKSIRRKNYQYLMSLISTIPQIKPIYPTLQADNMPMGLPIYLTNVSRDRINEALADASISLSIHWDALLDDPRTNQDPLVVKMAGNILTLPIDQYTSKNQLNYLASNLAEVIAKSN